MVFWRPLNRSRAGLFRCTSGCHRYQMLADLLTIAECVGDGKVTGIHMAYLGDTRNNVTYDLMRAAALMGFHLRVAGPPYVLRPTDPALDVCIDGCVLTALTVCQLGRACSLSCSGPDYHVEPAVLAEVAALSAVSGAKVTVDLMKQARPGAIFMNCLPAMRGMEQEAAVIDGPQSVVFQQAENRLHAQKALLHTLLASS